MTNQEKIKMAQLRTIIIGMDEQIGGLEGVLAAIVTELGGSVEGQPTHRGNLLQRVRQLRSLEQAAAARMAQP